VGSHISQLRADTRLEPWKEITPRNRRHEIQSQLLFFNTEGRREKGEGRLKKEEGRSKQA
jgi:hypothetical protein